MEFGQVLDPSYNPRTHDVYAAFIEYFRNPPMKKIKDVGGYSMYMCRIHVLIGKGFRYLIAMVKQDDHSPGHEQPLSKMDWNVFQTRTLEQYHDLPPHGYTAKRHPLLKSIIKMENQDEKKTTYTCEGVPVKVTLLHTRPNNVYQYNPSGTLMNALETYQTVISLS